MDSASSCANFLYFKFLRWLCCSTTTLKHGSSRLMNVKKQPNAAATGHQNMNQRVARPCLANASFLSWHRP